MATAGLALLAEAPLDWAGYRGFSISLGGGRRSPSRRIAPKVRIGCGSSHIDAIIHNVSGRVRDVAARRWDENIRRNRAAAAFDHHNRHHATWLRQHVRRAGPRHCSAREVGEMIGGS
jgi:hypothetical protein